MKGKTSRRAEDVMMTLIVMAVLILVPMIAVKGGIALLGTIGEQKIEKSARIEGSIGRGPVPNILILSHKGGDRLEDAFMLNNGVIFWVGFSVRINGEPVQVWGGAKLNGKDNVGMTDFAEGDNLVLLLMHEFKKGDQITLVYGNRQIGSHIVD